MNSTLLTLLTGENLSNLSDTIRQSAMISRTGTGVKNGIALVNPISFKDSGARVEMLGQTLKNETSYNPTTWAEWTVNEGIVGDSTGLEFTADGANWRVAYLPAAFKENTKYGYLFNIVSNTTTNGKTYIAGDNVPMSTPYYFDGIGNMKIIDATSSGWSTNRITIAMWDTETSGNKIKIKDIRAIELPAGSQIEADFTNKTADQLAQDYPFFNGTVNVVNPVVKTVGKNLFDKINNYLEFGYYQLPEVKSAASWRCRTSGGTVVEPSTTYVTSTGVIGVRCCSVMYYLINGIYIDNLFSYSDLVFTTPADCKYVELIFAHNGDGDATSFIQEEIDMINDTFMMKRGSVATAYEAFKSNSLALTGTLRSVVDTTILYQDRLYNQYGKWYIDRYVNPADGLKQAMATESATVTGVPYIYKNGMTMIEISVIAPIVDTQIPYSAIYGV